MSSLQLTDGLSFLLQLLGSFGSLGGFGRRQIASASSLFLALPEQTLAPIQKFSFRCFCGMLPLMKGLRHAL